MSTASIGGGPQYTVRIGEQIKAVPVEFSQAAAVIAGPNADHFLSDGDFENYIRENHASTVRSGAAPQLDPQIVADRATELKCAMAKSPNPVAKTYHNFMELIAECDKLQEANPSFVKKTSLGKTQEGRDLWMYTITDQASDDAGTSAKPGVVLLKNIHAREWATAESSPALMHQLLDGIDKDPAKQQRLKDSVIYLLACQNPDGREYSFNIDNMWRKNRAVLTDNHGKPTGKYGVDPNRNWGEPQPILNHGLIWDPLGTPGKQGPTLGQTSDSPSSEIYRGKSAASEPEVATAERIIAQPNVIGVNDCHSYSADVLLPWDHSHAAAPDAAVYQDVTQAMVAATGYTVESGISLYPNSGDTVIFGAANGKISITTEIGQSFQPSASLLPKVVGEAVRADLAMIDTLIKKSKDDTLGPRIPIMMPQADSTRTVESPSISVTSDPISRYFLD